MADDRKKRNVAIEKTISELTKDDIRVKVVGAVVEKDESNYSILIDDGKANIRVLLSPELFSKVETGKLIRVIGIVVPPLEEGENVELKAEIIQDFSKLNPELYEKYLNLKKQYNIR
jgi:aspartyl/asparaginyl-tRNA synthetase